MPSSIPKAEEKRRIEAFESTKGPEHPSGNITKAAEKLGDISPNALSRFLLQRRIKTNRDPLYSKAHCVEALKTYIRQNKKVPSRDEFIRHGGLDTRFKTHWPTWPEFLEAAGIIGDPAKILLLDIETAPMIAMVWGTRKQYINHEWIAENGYILCWTAKWLGSDEAIFKKFRKGKPLELLGPIHALLDKARVVVHYNGRKFDVPTLNREFLIHGMRPPSPYKQVDCLQTMWDTFAFPVNKLDYIAKVLGIGQKLEHEGAQFWKDCMNDVPEAWAKMEAYNRHDVVLLEGVYKRILPWIKNHPNLAAITKAPVCPSCGSYDFNRSGEAIAQVLMYEQYECMSCGSWFRGTKTISPKGERFRAAV